MDDTSLDRAPALLAANRRTSPTTINIAKLAMIVHEFRTPLMAIQGLNALAEHEKDPCVLADGRARIGNITNHLLEIVNDILDLAKEGDAPPRSENSIIAIDRLLQDVVAVVQTVALTRNILILKRVDVDFPIDFVSNPQRLRQVLINLMTNAIKLSNEGSAVLLRAKKDPENDQVCLAIEDEGVGMTEAELEQIFQPFGQLSRTSPMDTCGTGLGLPICRSMIENMGGTITVTSALGKGSSFTVCFPYRPESVETLSLHTEKPTVAFAGKTKPNILIVDDGDLIRDVLRLLLINAGYFAEAVGTPNEAISALKEQSYDLVLVDQNLGAFRGDHLAKQIRDLPNVNPSLKIVGMSAYYSTELRNAGLKAGMNDFVLKSTRPDELMRIVEDSFRDDG